MWEIVKNILRSKFVKIAGIVIIIFFVLMSIRQKNLVSQTSLLKTQNKFVAGTTTLDEVKGSLGEPKSEDSNKFFFDSNNSGRQSEAQFIDDKLSIYKETVSPTDKEKASEIQATYGLPQKTLYNELSSGGYYLFVYSDKGIAFVGKPLANIVLEIWYFAPTTYEDFKEKFASNYSESLEGVNK